MNPKQIADFYPLSPMQQGMLFHTQYAPDSGMYIGQMICRLSGAFDLTAFERAWQRVVDRHPILRSGFISGEVKEPVQLVHRAVKVPFEVQDWRAIESNEQQQKLSDFVLADQRRGFDPAVPPLVRFTLLQMAEREWQFIWTYHHILFDGWALPLILREVFAFYEAFHQGRELALPQPRPFRDYIVWLRKQDLKKAETFWRARLSGFTAPTSLRVDRAASTDESASAYAEESLLLSAELTAALQALARQRQLTLNTLAQGAWALLLARYSGDNDVLFGATVSGRPTDLPGAEQMIGLFINTLPVRVQVEPDANLSDWLRELQQQQLEMRQYEYSPLVQIQSWSDVPPGLPLFESILVFENTPVSSAAGQAGDTALQLSDVQSNQQTNFPLTLAAMPGEQLKLVLGYDALRFDQSAIALMLSHLRTLLENFIASPHARLADVRMLSAAELRQELIEWNDTAKDFPADRCTHQLFEEQAARTPDAAAVSFEESTLSYRELNERANQMAHYLQCLGVGPETLVGVCVEPSLEMVVGILGIMKAGGAYVPLDPHYPADRLAFMLADSQVQIVLTQSHLKSAISNLKSEIELLCLDTEWPRIAPESAANVVSEVRPHHLAYVIYTSGSTGQPKGTLLEHRNLCNFTMVALEQFAITPESRVLQFASFSFDASVSEIVMALCGGARLVLARRETLTSPDTLAELLRREKITTVTLPPSLLAALSPDNLPALTTVVSAGESCAWEVAERWAEGRRFLNGYGPTEATVGSSYYFYKGRRDDAATVPIGGPVSNAQMYVLDARQQPVPVGVPGELYIGGAGVARGYLHRPELTAEKFIAWKSEFGIRNSEAERQMTEGREMAAPLTTDYRLPPTDYRLYRTGDLVRRLADGSLEFLGRVDEQVKIRGFRIEPGEVEAVLNAHPAVQAAVVIAREDVAGDKRLTAYYVAQPDATISISDWRSFAQQQLPGWLVPSAFVSLDSLPLTPNGKIDRRALKSAKYAPDKAASESEFIAPRTATEEIIAGIYAQVLNVSRVGAEDNFFELGGHSLLATQVTSRLRSAFGVELPLHDLFESPSVSALAGRVEAVSRAAQGIQSPPITAIARAGELPLSYAQQRLWFLAQLEPDNPFYNIPSALQLSGTLDVAVLERSLNEVIKRHESLRTTILTRDGRASQVIAPELMLTIPVEDLSHLSADERDRAVSQRVADEAQLSFDLERGPLVRVRLLRIEAETHVALFTLHHIISDGWSMGVFIREITACYAALVNQQPVPLQPLAIQYADFAHWQREWLQGETLAAQIEYWRQQLSGAPAIIELPTDRPRPAIQTYRGATHTFELSPQLSAQLNALSRREGVTLFMTLLAAFQTLLSRYAGQDDISIGTPIAGRNRQELEGLIGFFINTLVMRTDLSGNPTFRELLKRVRATTLGAYAHQELPFEMVVDALQPERNLSHTPLFQVMFVLQNMPRSAQQLSGLTVTALEADSATAKFDLTLTMNESGNVLLGAFEYNTDLFDAATIERMTGHFINLLSGIIATPDAAVMKLALLTAPELQQLLIEWNDTAADFPADQCAHQLFEEQAARTPENIAVSFAGQTLTYRELNERANQLAHYLQRLGVGPETLVGLCIERSLEMVIGLLGILKAGGAYVPLDPHYPADRLAFMLADSQVRIVLTQSHLKSAISNLQSEIELLCLDTDWPRIEQESAANVVSEVRPHHLAYVIYTSGSTGRPKGALIEHRGLVNYLTWCLRAYPVSEGAGAPVHSSLSFDLTITGLYAPLLSGRRVDLAGEDTGVESLSALLHQQSGYSLIKITPAHLELLGQQIAPEAAAGVTKSFIIGGEQLLPEHIAFWQRHAPETKLINEYGPTETVVGCCVYTARGDEKDRAVPIGRPIINTQLYILDKYQQPVPIGVPGELYIGGAGVGRGYLNRPELTAEKFIAWSVVSGQWSVVSDKDNGQRTTDNGQRLYRTGDLARFLPDGNIQFLGRMDEQVKIRGFRIEPGEIEAVLASHPAVREVTVLAREDQPGHKRLVAYLSARQSSVPVAELRQYLKERLPEYMIPAAFVWLESLPLTTNGKVDRRALPAPESDRPELETAFVAPRTEAEKKLAEIWQQILGVQQVGIHDNFFDLGGDSILSIQVIARARQADLNLTPRQFFQHPTIAGLAAVAGAEAPVQAEQGAVTGPVQLTPIQHWFFEEHTVTPHHWNMSILLATALPLNPQILEQAVGHLLRHHDALRLRFRPTVNGWQQFNAPVEETIPFSFADYSQASAKKQRKQLEAACASLQTSLHLSAGPLLRVAYFNPGEQGGRLLIAAHHLVVDWFSLNILLEDLVSLYQQLSRGDQAHLPPKTTSYQQWAARLTEYAQSAAPEAELNYWMNVTGDEIPLLPVDYPKGEHTEDSVEQLSVELSEAETSALLQQVAAACGAQMNEVLLAALGRACARWTGQRQLMIEMEGHGREDILAGVDVSRTVGWFTSIFPVRLETDPAADPQTSISSVREQMRAIPQRGIGYGLLRYLSRDEAVRNRLRVPNRSLVNFNYLGQTVQLPATGLPMHPAPESRGPEHHPQDKHNAMLYVVGGIAAGQLTLNWLYSRNQYRPATIERLSSFLTEELRLFISRINPAQQ
ncbi:MAG: amino acid adenylation domain-containing protein [Blastocatellia bacterium]